MVTDAVLEVDGMCKYGGVAMLGMELSSHDSKDSCDGSAMDGSPVVTDIAIGSAPTTVGTKDAPAVGT